MATTTRTTKAASGTKKTSTATASKSAAKTAVKTEAPAEPKAEPVAKQPVTQHEIAMRAYYLWEQRGGHHGSHEQDWLEAERQLTAR